VDALAELEAIVVKQHLKVGLFGASLVRQGSRRVTQSRQHTVLYDQEPNRHHSEHANGEIQQEERTAYRKLDMLCPPRSNHQQR
jgi:hypothetical protein